MSKPSGCGTFSYLVFFRYSQPCPCRQLSCCQTGQSAITDQVKGCKSLINVPRMSRAQATPRASRASPPAYDVDAAQRADPMYPSPPHHLMCPSTHGHISTTLRPTERRPRPYAYHHSNEVAIAQPKGDVPANAQLNDFSVEHPSAIDGVTGDRFGHSEPLFGARIFRESPQMHRSHANSVSNKNKDKQIDTLRRCRLLSGRSSVQLRSGAPDSKS